MEEQGSEQVLGAATLLAIERLEKMTKQSKVRQAVGISWDMWKIDEDCFQET